MIAARGRMLAADASSQSACRAAVAKPCVRRAVEVHLADRRGLVVQVAEPFAHGEHLVGEPGRELRHPDGVRAACP